MITLKSLIEKTEYKLVYDCLMNHYKSMKETSVKKFEILYEELLSTFPEINVDNMYIYINAFKDDEKCDSIYLDKFDENDNGIYFDVSGKDDNHCGYSIVASTFEGWLGYFVDDKTLNNMTYPNIIAHCLWEMTVFGFKH